MKKNEIKFEARSGIVIWLTTLAIFAFTIAFATMYNEFDSVGSYLLILIILIVSGVMTASFIIRNYILVTEKTITICFGMTTTILNIESLISLKKMTSFIASASASTKRIEIQYSGGVIYVSPKDEEKFIQTVCFYNPNVKI